MRLALSLAAALLFSSAAPAERIIWKGKDWSNVPRTKLGRFCDGPNCRMCNRLFGPMPGYVLNWDYTSRKVPQTQRRTQPASNRRPTVPVDPYTALDPSPMDAIEIMLSLAQVRPGDTVYDAGCGDGRILIAAAKRGVKAVGVEINEETFKIAERNTRPYGDRIQVYHGDACDFAPRNVSVVTLYLFPTIIAKLMPNFYGLPSGTRVISYAHPIPGVDCEKYIFGEHHFYLWVVE